MKVIHVLRKPLSEGTVAANTLKHGTGGLNIDASRVGTEERTYKGSGISQMRYTDGRAGLTDGRGRDMEFKVSGRWPANVILQHLDGCRNGICEPGCPVARLDADSLAGGMHSAGLGRSAKREAGKTGMFPVDGDGHRFGDKGGASRFYKQIGGSDE